MIETSQRPAKSPRAGRRLKGFSLGEAGIYYALALIWVVLEACTHLFGAPNFLNPANLANILYQSSFVAIIAVPMTLVLISGNFDLSVAATAAISAACVLLLSDVVGIYAAMAISLVAGAFIGLVNAAVVQGLGINAFIVTLATMTALRGVLLIITGGHTASANDREIVLPLKWIENGVWVLPNLWWCAGAIVLAASAFEWWQKRRPRLLLMAVGIVLFAIGFYFDASWALSKPVYYMAAITAIAYLITRFTMVGRRLQAVGANSEAARLIGIDINRYRVVPFVLNGLAAGICRTPVRGANWGRFAKRHGRPGADSNHGSDPWRHLTFWRVRKCLEISGRRRRDLQFDQWLRHPRVRKQLSGSD